MTDFPVLRSAYRPRRPNLDLDLLPAPGMVWALWGHLLVDLLATIDGSFLYPPHLNRTLPVNSLRR